MRTSVPVFGDLVRFIPSSRVLALALQRVGGASVVEAVACNRFANREVVEPMYSQFRSAKLSRLLLENSEDGALAEFLLGRGESRVTVLQAAVNNWFLPDDLYLDVLSRMPDEHVVGVLRSLDGYRLGLKDMAAARLDGSLRSEWFALHISGRSDEELLELVLDEQPTESWAELVEAVMFHRPHLVDYFEGKIPPGVAGVLSAGPLDERVLFDIMGCVSRSPLTYVRVVEQLLIQPWISPDAQLELLAFVNTFRKMSGFDLKASWLHLYENHRWVAGESFRECSDLEQVAKYLWAVPSYKTLRKHLILDVVQNERFLSYDSITKWVIANLDVVGGGRASWFPKNVTDRLRLLVASNQPYSDFLDALDTPPDPLTWYYGVGLGYRWEHWLRLGTLGALNYVELEPTTTPVVRRNRTDPRTPRKEVVTLIGNDRFLRERIGDLTIEGYIEKVPPILGSEIGVWLHHRLGDADTVESGNAWEMFFRLYPNWDRTLNELVATAQKLGADTPS
ncbi:MAG: hypothetical protein WC184_11620 [Acidimicrobiia bacterium]